jgi:hypothetical protein
LFFWRIVYRARICSLLVNILLDITEAHLCSCVGPRASTWLLAHPTTSTFRSSLAHYFTTLHTHFGLPHPTIAHLSLCQCGHTIDDLSTHLLQCPYGNECIRTLDKFWGIVVVIVLENKTHVQKEVSHLFPRHIWRQVDIFITKDGFRTLMNIVATPLWVKWEDEIPTPKVGDLESSRTPECLEFNSRDQNTLHWGVLGVIGKVLKCRCPKCPHIGHLDICSPSYGQKKGRESN